MTQSRFVIVGGGLASVTAIQNLRKLGFEGEITLVQAEVHEPYDRPPLSKNVLVRGFPEHVPLLTLEELKNFGVNVISGIRATALSPNDHTITLSDGRLVSYNKVLLATGARPRSLPLLQKLGPLSRTFRTLDDSIALRESLIQNGSRLIVIGAGVLGLEIAASAINLGAAVTVLELGDRAMARVVPPILGTYIEDLHRRHGVDLHFGVHLTDATLTKSANICLNTGEDETFIGDVLVSAIGVHPNVELALTAGIDVEDGILVDEAGRTNVPDVFAAGDVARQWKAETRCYRRIETWASAQEQAVTAAISMFGGNLVSPAVPWFWSDQYDTNLQTAGCTEAHEWLIRGDERSGSFTVFGLDPSGVLVAASTINNGRDMRPAKTLIEKGALVPRELLLSLGCDLRAVAKRY